MLQETTQKEKINCEKSVDSSDQQASNSGVLQDSSDQQVPISDGIRQRVAPLYEHGAPVQSVGDEIQLPTEQDEQPTQSDGAPKPGDVHFQPTESPWAEQSQSISSGGGGGGEPRQRGTISSIPTPERDDSILPFSRSVRPLGATVQRNGTCIPPDESRSSQFQQIRPSIPPVQPTSRTVQSQRRNLDEQQEYMNQRFDPYQRGWGQRGWRSRGQRGWRPRGWRPRGQRGWRTRGWSESFVINCSAVNFKK